MAATILQSPTKYTTANSPSKLSATSSEPNPQKGKSSGDDDYINGIPNSNSSSVKTTITTTTNIHIFTRHSPQSPLPFSRITTAPTINDTTTSTNTTTSTKSKM